MVEGEDNLYKSTVRARGILPKFVENLATFGITAEDGLIVDWHWGMVEHPRVGYIGGNCVLVRDGTTGYIFEPDMRELKCYNEPHYLGSSPRSMGLLDGIVKSYLVQKDYDGLQKGVIKDSHNCVHENFKPYQEELKKMGIELIIESNT